jgi:hypothetical protein
MYNLKSLKRTMKIKDYLCISILCTLLWSCKTQKLIQPDTETMNKKPFTSTHVFIAKFKEIKFHTCLGLTTLCPKECSNSGNFAVFNISAYKTHIVNGEAGTEKLTSYNIQISDYYKNEIKEDYVNLIKKLKNGDEVTIYVDYIYDTTKSVVKTEEKIISISKK